MGWPKEAEDMRGPLSLSAKIKELVKLVPPCQMGGRVRVCAERDNVCELHLRHKHSVRNLPLQII